MLLHQQLPHQRGAALIIAFDEDVRHLVHHTDVVVDDRDGGRVEVGDISFHVLPVHNEQQLGWRELGEVLRRDFALRHHEAEIRFFYHIGATIDNFSGGFPAR